MCVSVSCMSYRTMVVKVMGTRTCVCVRLDGFGSSVVRVCDGAFKGDSSVVIVRVLVCG